MSHGLETASSGAAMLWLRGLVQSHLDLRFSPAPAVETRVVDRPGLWMSAEALAALTADVRAVARETLPTGDLTYGVLSGDPERLKASVITLVYDRQSGRPVAFNALAWMPVTLRGRPVDVLHMGLVMVSPAVRSQGLSWILYGLTCFLLFARGGMRPVWISNVTQVPAVVGMVAESFAQVFPTPDGAPQSFEHLLIARQIMRSHRHVFGVGADAGFDEARGVITNAYTGGSDDLKKSFEQAAKHRQDKYNAFCNAMLDYARGDDFLQIGQVNMAAAQKYAFAEVPRASLPGVVLSGAFLALQSLLLPLIHWLDARRPWGSLRPHRSARA
ncbi:MAG: hypothetical protein NW200_07270 [Hyphomonadaceae bacterium]|nr:hypothetical protein [Hyphomonadaceae bacterium]